MCPFLSLVAIMSGVIDSDICDQMLLYKIRRGPKLEGYAFANFGYSSGTEGELRHEMKNSCWV